MSTVNSLASQSSKPGTVAQQNPTIQGLLQAGLDLADPAITESMISIVPETGILKPVTNENPEDPSFDQILIECSASDEQPANAASGKKPRRRRRPREERGLPSHELLLELAKAYLLIQRRLWRELRTKGLLPKPTAENLERMARKFKSRFLARDSEIAAFSASNLGDLGAAYLRYSSEKSNPRSLVQQLERALSKAHANGHFVPWSYVFADAAVTGTTAGRRGYQMMRASVVDNSLRIAVVYIDEIGRVSRDAIEALDLGRMITSLGKRLIGVADGFDSDTPMSKWMLSMFAMLHEWFIDQLIEKVLRGQNHAFERGGNLGLPALGYKLVPMTDVEGRAIYGKDGEQLRMLVIDEEQARHVLLAFELYGERGWSRIKIARHFNAAPPMAGPSVASPPSYAGCLACGAASRSTRHESKDSCQSGWLVGCKMNSIAITSSRPKILRRRGTASPCTISAARRSRECRWRACRKKRQA